MCAQGTPICLGLLHTLRLEADRSTGDAAAWLRLNGLDRACAPARSLAEVLASHLAPPGEAGLWPHEQAVLEALARVDREPDRSEHLLAFLPPVKLACVMALLAELSHQLSAGLADRLKHNPPEQALRLQ